MIYSSTKLVHKITLMAVNTAYKTVDEARDFKLTLKTDTDQDEIKKLSPAGVLCILILLALTTGGLSCYYEK